MCKHDRTEFGIVYGVNGALQFREGCCVCEENVRGAGNHVRHAEIRSRGIRPEDSRVLADYRPKALVAPAVLDGVEVKWFAWAAEYPETSIYGLDSHEVKKR